MIRGSGLFAGELSSLVLGPCPWPSRGSYEGFGESFMGKRINILLLTSIVSSTLSWPFDATSKVYGMCALSEPSVQIARARIVKAKHMQRKSRYSQILRRKPVQANKLRIEMRKRLLVAIPLLATLLECIKWYSARSFLSSSISS